MVDMRNARLIETLAETGVGASFLMQIGDSITNFADEVRLALDTIQRQLVEINNTNLEPARFTDAQAEGLIRRVRVTTAGTAVQGPGIDIPKGFKTVVRQRRHTGTPNGYVALSERAVSSTVERAELQDNDAITFAVSNWSKLWFDADTNTTDFELIAEQ